ncbi:MAG: hypothetical protein K5854_01610 [Prevotella sp.]|nr:hypothetical protein [Prevotella sp.]
MEEKGWLSVFGLVLYILWGIRNCNFAIPLLIGAGLAYLLVWFYRFKLSVKYPWLTTWWGRLLTVPPLYALVFVVAAAPIGIAEALGVDLYHTTF